MPFWTNRQVEFFTERWHAGDSYTSIADAMAERGWPARDRSALVQKRYLLGLAPRQPARVTGARCSNGRLDLWPPERTAVLRAALDAGRSYSRIARDMNLTLGAVAGKAYRLKVEASVVANAA